jgi:hypothetical protein
MHNWLNQNAGPIFGFLQNVGVRKASTIVGTNLYVEAIIEWKQLADMPF